MRINDRQKWQRGASCGGHVGTETWQRRRMERAITITDKTDRQTGLDY